ncbi:MAG: sigma-54 dependent transcriptional regulator [Alphaproteobacteria bacterium]|nr:sigma-54 dependent transcriptional regulator [Alphaproteobacteria bacterium]
MRLLLIGSMNGQIGAAGKIALAKGGTVNLANDINDALDKFHNGLSVDVIMCDVKEDISKLTEALNDEKRVIPVIACGIAQDAQTAVRAIKAGAKEYIPLPPDAELIGAVLASFTEEKHPVVYADPKTERVLQMAKQIAPSTASVLITGESGTGKEVFARFLHENSKRASGPFVAVNCAAIPENLLESELFGYEKGAFTGAVSRHIGKFEEANGGTILLDEISEMDLRLQAKLLRVIQERQVDRLGGKAPVKVDVRILATSNRNMKTEVQNKTFREDLYFRLNVVNLALPALRERKGDIIPLVNHFIDIYSELNDVKKKELSLEAKTKLENYSWPGNVRELENTVQRAVILSITPQIMPEDIILSEAEEGTTTNIQENNEGVSNLVGRTVAEVEQDLILDTLKSTYGNRTHAATILGISIRTLRNKLNQYSAHGVDIPPAPNNMMD